MQARGGGWSEIGSSKEPVDTAVLVAINHAINRWTSAKKYDDPAVATLRPVSFHVELAAGRTVMAAGGAAVWRPTGMDGWILNYTAAGSGRIGSGSRRMTTRVGDFILFQPLAVHDYGADAEVGHWTHMWVYFFPQPTWTEWLTWPEIAPGIVHLSVSAGSVRDRAVAAFTELIAAAHGPWPRPLTLAANYLEQTLLWCDVARGGPAGQRLDARIQRAVETCHAHFSKPWTVSGLARLGGLSPSRFAHLFTAQLGVSPLVYLEHVRLQAAQSQLLGTGRRIADIAAAVGISDPAWFAQRFRKRFGQSPRAFRSATMRDQPDYE